MQRCIEYARSHNIQIKQQVLQRRLSELQLQQSRLSRIPSLNGSGNYGYNFGRSIDPTTNQFVGSQLSFSGLSLNTGVTLFSWFQVRNTIAANKYAAEASNAVLDKMMNDISLNVANAYLQMLLAEEQTKVSEEQIALDQSQLANTTQQVKAGALPESNEADLEAQLARDSATYITNKNNILSTILQMKALLNLDFRTEFTPEQPDVAKIPILNLATLTPEEIFNDALRNQPQLIADSLQVLSSEKQVAATKATRYPSLSIGAGLGTNYSSSYARPEGEVITQIPATPIGSVKINGSDYMVNSLPQSITSPKYVQPPLGTQIGDNLRENIGLNLNIPIFNGYQTHLQIHRAKINLENLKLTHEQDVLTLK
ncbi:MAG: TolC family protein, partial [Chitinophagaceae bacterium]